jgi:hypothetical protein
MPFSNSITHPVSNDREISKLLTAAVVNSNFRKLLLTNPAQALAGGYNGEAFRLSKEEREHVMRIKARTLAEFASMLIDKPVTAMRKPVYTLPEVRAFAPSGLD